MAFLELTRGGRDGWGWLFFFFQGCLVNRKLVNRLWPPQLIVRLGGGQLIAVNRKLVNRLWPPQLIYQFFCAEGKCPGFGIISLSKMARLCAMCQRWMELLAISSWSGRSSRAHHWAQITFPFDCSILRVAKHGDMGLAWEILFLMPHLKLKLMNLG